MKKKTKRRIEELLFQIIPVMVGVFLGYLVSDWAESSKNDQQISSFKTNLIAELEYNKSLVGNVFEYHKMLRDSSRVYSSKTPTKPPRFFRGIRLFPLMDSAYETGLQTGLINGLSLEEIQEVNKVYTLQEFYNGNQKIVMTGLVTIDLVKERQRAAQFLSITLTDVVLRERELTEAYSLLLENLKRED